MFYHNIKVNNATSKYFGVELFGLSTEIHIPPTDSLDDLYGSQVHLLRAVFLNIISVGIWVSNCLFGIRS